MITTKTNTYGGLALCFGLGFTWTFLGKQNERAKVRSDVLYVRFLVNKGIQKLPKSDKK